MDRWLRRTTVWQDHQANVVQIAVCLLDEAWEPQAEVVEPVGPFDDVAEVERGCLFAARNLARGQLAGQGELLL